MMTIDNPLACGVRSQESHCFMNLPFAANAICVRSYSQACVNSVIRLAFLLACASLSQSASPAPSRITVSAGGLDRFQTVVSFPKPLGWKQTVVLKTPEGNELAVQYDDEGNASFIIPELKKNHSITINVSDAVSAAARPRVEANRESDGIAFKLEGKPIIRYQAEAGALPRPEIKPAFKRGGYLHPVHTPAGRVITDDFPTNHVHHHGIWSAWTNTEFEGRKPDFWNMGAGKAKVDFSSLTRQWSGSVHGGFVSKHVYTDLVPATPVDVLDETWRVQVYAISNKRHPAWIFDITSTQLLRGQSPLKLPEYRYGGLGFRGNTHWDGKDNWIVLTSNGETDRVKAHATRANWCYLGGMLDGEQAGIAVLCHPSNFRFPQPMRVHPSEPFFNYTPQQAGDMEITPGKPYVSKYRFAMLDGRPDKAELDRLWNDYATPPTVNLK